jgi:hypothetical protein
MELDYGETDSSFVEFFLGGVTINIFTLGHLQAFVLNLQDKTNCNTEMFF